MTFRRLLLALAWASLSAVVLAQPRPVAPAASAPSVKTLPFLQAAIQPQREAPAQVVPRNEAKLAAEVPGKVLRWTADVGARVSRGELLVALDDTEYRLARDRAQAAVQASEARQTLARQQLKRAQELVQQGFLSREALNARETELQLVSTELAGNRAQLATARHALAKARVTAPFHAVVTQRLAQAGEFVGAGTPLYVLTQVDGAEVSAQVSLADVDILRRSRRLEFAGLQGVVPLRLLRTGGTVTAPARTVEVRLQPQAGSAAPVTGSAGVLRWVDERPHVPPTLLVQRDRTLGVFVVEQGRARFIPVPGAQEGRAAPVELSANAQIVVQGQAALRDGMPVQTQP